MQQLPAAEAVFLKWHKIQKGIELTPTQQEYVVNIIMQWIEMQL